MKKLTKNFLNTLFYITVCLSLTSCKTADINRTIEALQNHQALDEKTVAAGLKQALNIGVKNSINQTSQSGGFNNNPLIRLALPQQLDSAAKTLRKVGLGSYVDTLENQMNKSAESATGAALNVFTQSITNMSLADAWGILRGPENAATNYFKQNTQKQLTKKFKPIITNSMQQVGLYSDYKNLLNAYDKIPFTDKPDLNIENHIMQGTLDGLFSLVAKEEKKIRENPQARVTDLLKRVFSQQNPE